MSLSHYISHLTALDQREAAINPSAVTSDPLYEQVSLYCKGQAKAWVQENNPGGWISSQIQDGAQCGQEESSNHLGAGFVVIMAETDTCLCD